MTNLYETVARNAAQRRRDQVAVRVERADVTTLPDAAHSFDAVISYLTLHHVIDWTNPVQDAARGLPSGGTVVGYDVTDSRLARPRHRLDGSPHRLLTLDELAEELEAVGVRDVSVTVSARRHLMRFQTWKPAG